MNSFLKYGALVLMLLVSLDGFTQPEPRQLEGKWGFVNDKGEWVVKAKYDEVKPFSEDLAAVRKKDKWGFIFESGKWAIKPRFSKVTSFSEGKAGVVWLKKSNGLWGFIDRQGLPIIAPALVG